METSQSRQIVAREVAALLDHELQQERRALLGDRDRVLDGADDLAGLLDAGGGDVEAFRAEARAWLEANFPDELKRDPAQQMAAAMGQPETPAGKVWREAMGAKGWGTPTWPAEHGGGGLSRQEARVLAEEMAKIGARNPIGGMGVMMFGPTLIEYGTPELKAQHLPGIIKGEVRWCQGYSEPGAGSDLASLQTKAVEDGDDFLISGSKIWTSTAAQAQMMFCLVRTSNEGKRQEGISFLLIDMKTPGIKVDPIYLADGTRTPMRCECSANRMRIEENGSQLMEAMWSVERLTLTPASSSSPN